MRIKATIAAVGLTIGGSFAAIGVGAAPAMASSCPDNGFSTKDGRTGKLFAASNVNIRTGPSTSCASVGEGQTSHQVRYDCWKLGSDGYTWTHLWDYTTNRGGWSRDTLLNNDGSFYAC